MRERSSVISTVFLLSAILFGKALTFTLEWPEWGRCPDLAVQQDFNVVNYQGKWWEQAAYNNERVEGKARCVHTIYSLTKYGNGVVTVENRAIVEKTNKWEGINGTAFEADPSKNEGKLIVSFPVGIFGHVEGPYWVLGTDYDSYTVVYSCQNFLFFWRYYTIWFLGRYQIFPTDEDQADFFRKANNILESRNFDPSIMHLSNQQNCDI